MKSSGELAATFCAYHEFERVKLETALQSKQEYNAEKHQNDLFDAEQLIYLGSPEMNFLTGDKGFNRVNKSKQFGRIKIVSADYLANSANIQAFLRQVTGVAAKVEAKSGN